MKIFICSTLLGGAFFLLSCQGEMPIYRPQVSSDASRALAEKGFNFELKAQNVDAYDFTFGAQEITLQGTLAVSKSALLTKRQVYLGSKVSLTAEEKASLASLCQDIGLSSGPDRFVAATSLPPDGSLYVQWRSHHSLSQKQALAALIEKSKTSVRCLLSIQLGQGENGPQVTLALEPIPVEGQNLAGTTKVSDAINEGLMLIDAAPTLDLIQGQVFEVTTPAAIKPSIPALNGLDILAVAAKSKGAECRIHVNADKSKIGNPKDTRTFDYGQLSEKAYQLGEIRPLSIGGRILPACAEFKPKALALNLQNEVSCGGYRAVQDEGLEAGCQWTVEIINPQDPGNVVPYTLAMEKMTFATVDVSTPLGGATILPEAAINPVRAKTTNFVGFDPDQLTSMEQTFDFWIAASRESYLATFDKLVTRVTYMGNTGQCIPGVLAYADFNGPEIYWCELAGLNANDKLAANSPLKIMLVGVTAFHEVLHNRGRGHDLDEAQYAPCAGTARSALLSFDAIKTCTEDYCLPFKDLALTEYIAEIDYSLGADARRFQGQCQIWNTGLGLNPNNFGN